VRFAKTIRSLPWWADLITVLLFAAGIYQTRVALIPVIQPDAAISSSWADLPVTATNSGNFFDMNDAQFFCKVTNVSWKGLGTTIFRVVGDAEWTVPRPPITIRPSTTVTFPCDISKNVTAKYDNGSQMPVALIHMRIRTTYKINLGLFYWHRQAVSQVFTWREVSGGFQWLSGDTSDSIK
jgi:hypothetical protein